MHYCESEELQEAVLTFKKQSNPRMQATSQRETFPSEIQSKFILQELTVYNYNCFWKKKKKTHCCFAQARNVNKFQHILLSSQKFQF